MRNESFKKGFTIIEIMVVFVIIGLLATLIAPKIINRPNEARITKAKTDIRAIEAALKLYKLDTGSYPTTEQGLKALMVMPDIEPIPRGWKPGGYLEGEELPKDPWGNYYIYRSPGETEGRDYEIMSFGADGKEGGEGFDADIKSYEIK